MKKLVLLFIAVLLSACSAVVKIEGDQVLNSRLSVRVTDAWNKLYLPGSSQPYDMWTQEGLSLDHLRIWAGIKPGSPLMALGSVPLGQKAPRVPTFAAGMAPDQLVNLFEMLYSADGSLVKVTRVEPAVFAGEKGLRFEFAVARKRDDVELLGVGWVAVRTDELFAATFVAPKLAFYPRLLPRAEAIVKTAQIRS